MAQNRELTIGGSPGHSRIRVEHHWVYCAPNTVLNRKHKKDAYGRVIALLGVKMSRYRFLGSQREGDPGSATKELAGGQSESPRSMLE